MTDIERICPKCGAANAVDVHFCGACAAPLSSTALARRESALPARLEPKQAALAVGATGLAAIALRVGTALVKQVGRMLQEREPTEETEQAPLASTQPKKRSVMHVRRRWAIGDASGVRHWGTDEITIYEEE